MNAESKPTAKQLMASWQRIWARKLHGEPDELKDAMDSHVKLFPKGNHAEARERIKRTVNGYGADSAAVHALINRGQNNLRKL